MSSEDCNDGDSAVNPAAVELCDGVDNNCDGNVDEGVTDPYWPDADGDGYGDEGSTPTEACEPPSGYVPNADDCNDADVAYNPDADESDCTDPNDYNCDGSVEYADADGDGYPACEDCNDADAAVNPGATETWYDGVDADCDGASDYDADVDGYDSADYDGDDCDDADDTINPGADDAWYDGVDSDCDGASDYDYDGDGYDSADYGGDDCDDLEALVNPGMS